MKSEEFDFVQRWSAEQTGFLREVLLWLGAAITEACNDKIDELYEQEPCYCRDCRSQAPPRSEAQTEEVSAAPDVEWSEVDEDDIPW